MKLSKKCTSVIGICNRRDFVNTFRTGLTAKSSLFSVEGVFDTNSTTLFTNCHPFLADGYHIQVWILLESNWRFQHKTINRFDFSANKWKKKKWRMKTILLYSNWNILWTGLTNIFVVRITILFCVRCQVKVRWFGRAEIEKNIQIVTSTDQHSSFCTQSRNQFSNSSLNNFNKWYVPMKNLNLRLADILKLRHLNKHETTY